MFLFSFSSFWLAYANASEVFGKEKKVAIFLDLFLGKLVLIKIN